MLLVGGRDRSKLFPTTVLPRKRVFVENLTHHVKVVQFSSMQTRPCLTS